MKKLQALKAFIAAPYYMTWYVSKFGIGKTPVGTTKSDEGVMLLFGIVSGAVQLVLAFFIGILLLIFCW